ncbi:DUF5710 domain-containing protein [Aeromicrobium sp.]|uniref:DUF5710 domain-containing protein n=1 Tax=Aeromicrobium sp. TaxID=1871063 RepID=UPI0039E53B62
MAQRIWLDVPYGEKDAAKSLGARWDPVAKRWYAPRPGMASLQRWAPLPEAPDLLPGEDRSFGSGLFVDLVPSSCWFTNVRSCVSQEDWERLRRMITRRAGQRCEACGAPENRGFRRWLEGHERWHYDNESRTQSLKRLVCLCTDCHSAAHFGLAELKGKRDEALEHLIAVTGMTRVQALAHVDEAFSLWRQRSRHIWSLDLSMLTEAGVTLKEPPNAQQRPVVAHEVLTSLSPSVAPSPSSFAPLPTKPDSVTNEGRPLKRRRWWDRRRS